jgi:glutathione S-transferase
LAREGLIDGACKRSALKFRVTFDEFDVKLSGAPYLLGDPLTVIDIACFVYAYRLVLGGYPLARLHPRVDDWFESLHARPEFYEEVVPSPAPREEIEENRCRQEREGATIQAVAGWNF